MARTKNVRGGLGDEDPRRPPRLPADPKGKATKKVASKKRKYPDAETARAAAVTEAVEHVERGGARSGVVIADHLSPEAQGRLERIERLHGSPPRTVMMQGRRLPIMEPQPQGESQQEPQQQPPLAKPTEQTQEGQQDEETEQAPQPQLRRSGRTRAPVTPRADTQRRGSRPPPRP